ncbi:hypothetical protein [Prevotella nigrescens]|uniref:hypothetical protein n=1 Tax=Prevotella nigrescens TaxID=28133 RepID=UPI00360BDFDC
MYRQHAFFGTVCNAFAPIKVGKLSAIPGNGQAKRQNLRTESRNAAVRSSEHQNRT